jgi:hypothetical protein
LDTTGRKLARSATRVVVIKAPFGEMYSMSLEAIRNAVRAQSRASLSAPTSSAAAATSPSLTASERAALRTAARRVRRAGDQPITPPTGKFMWI